jgi:hypothetical protein
MTTLAATMSKARSRLTNKPTRLIGIDNRSSAGRRRRDLIRSHVDALGGPDKVSPAVMLSVTRAVDLTMIAEQLRAAALRGVAIDMGDLVRLEGAADRAVRRLGIGAQPKPATDLLHEHLSAKYGARDDEAEDTDA